MHVRGLVAAIIASVASAAPAAAQPFPPVTDTDYGIDLYQGGALGSIRIVAMGGAAVAVAEGSAGTIANAAAPAVRRATSTRSWDWDWHLDYLSSVRASDWDNNGVGGGSGSGVGVLTFGLAGMLGDWGLAAVATSQTIEFFGVDEMNQELPMQATTLQAKLALARAFWTEQITVGLAVRLGQFGVADSEETFGSRQLFTITGTSLEAGALWRPYLRDVRVGGSIALPVSGSTIEIADCDPMNCRGYILPERIEVPWQITGGFAWRFAPTAWNQWVGGNWRDERSLTLAADVLVTGSSPDAYGLEAFADTELQRSGRDVVVGVRGGAEYEWLPGRLRVRLGSYWEPSRFADVSGRLHGTFGLDIRVFQFELWGKHRGRISATGDIASRYTNLGASIGFWH